MSPADRERTQGAILDAIKRTGSRPPTDAEIADVAGVVRSLVTRWRNGEREIGVSELCRLAAHYGADVVWGPLLARSGAEVAIRPSRTIEAEAAALTALAAVVESLAALTPATHPASPGGAAVVGREWDVVGPALSRAEAAIETVRAHMPADAQLRLVGSR